MTNNKNMKEQFSRMKQLMNYGLNENKKQPYSGIEYSKVAADGKLYGIIREGTKFYIKVSSKKDNALVENFEYIGGFRNRKDHEYSSFAGAQKNFDFKLRSLAEAYGNGKNIVIESWNPDKCEELTVEATEKMKKEISRERQIMENTMKIFNNQTQTAVKPINEAKDCCGKGGDPFCEKPKGYDVKDTIEGSHEGGGDAKDAVDHEDVNLKKTDIVKESEQVLGWNENPDYMDKSHGTKIGDSQPFDGPEARNIDDGDKKITRTGEEKQGTIHEGQSMHDSDNQNTPKPGVGEIGDNDPFDGEMGRQIDEAIDDIDNDGGLEDDTDTGLGDYDTEDDSESLGDELVDDNGFDSGDADLEADDDTDYELEVGDEEPVGGGLEDRMTSIEDKLDQILSALGEEQYEDDDLYDDEGDEESYDDYEDEPTDDEGYEYEYDDEDDEEPAEDEEVWESRNYRKMVMMENAKRRAMNEGGMKPFRDAGRVPQGNMNKLNDFGKHPAWQKKVMELPPKDIQEFPGYYDMNDDSVRNDYPYGERIGDGAPFDIAPDSIDNAISESINRILKKKR